VAAGSPRDSAGAPLALVVEDDPSLLAVLAYNLRRRGFEVISAEDGHAGRSAIERSLAAITVVLLDRMLPGLDGFDLLHLIRADSTMVQTAVVLMTAHADPGIEERALAMGADAVVRKPFALADLFAIIDRVIVDRRSL
jgi:two-component system alkaline phosphatase synthesis response regulator PhoP